MHQFTIHPSSFILHPSSIIHHHIITPSHHPSSIIHHPSSITSSSNHHIITSSHHHIILHPSSNFQHAKNLRKSAKICEKLITTSPHHHITSFAFISGFSSTKFSGVRLGIKRSERSNISTKKALYNNIIIGFCSERTEYKLKG